MEILDGKRVSLELQEELKQEIDRLRTQTGKVPGLSVIIAGDDPASQSYVRSKDKMAHRLGIRSEVIRYNQDVPKETLIKKIEELNHNGEVNGILVQLPLPDHLNTWEILDFLFPKKDVDGFLPATLGMILLNRTQIYPCTPAGVMKLLDYYRIDVAGKNAVVLGRSFIVGKPISAMLTNRHATVTVCHSRTKNLKEIVRRADIVVAAVGVPGFVTPDMVKEGAVLVDVGINHLDQREQVIELCSEDQIQKFEKKGYGICGDIHLHAAKNASYYTPVPGGVGKMTVVMLMANTLKLFKTQANIE